MAATDPTVETETRLFESGATVILSVDEVGRGAIAGPCGVGVAAYTQNLEAPPAGIRDSKVVSEKKRIPLAPLVSEWLPASAVGYASADEIDSLGINKGLALAGARALEDVLDQLEKAGIDSTRAVILLDGSHNWLGSASKGIKVVTQVKADRDCLSVAAASIIAKVGRDMLMEDLANIHSQYGWAGNKGYGAAAHYSAIKEFGPVKGIHRMTWLKPDQI
jgi:ribonuclease HII